MPKENHENEKENTEYLINLHIAEYQNLNAKVTSFVNLAFFILSVFIGWLTFIGSIWQTIIMDIWVWLVLIVWYLFAAVGIWILHEQYHILTYVERILLPQLKAILPSKTFWGYEKYNLITSQSIFKQPEYWWIIVLLVVSIIIFCWVIYCRDLEKLDYIGVTLCSIIYMGLLRATIKTVKSRKNIVGDNTVPL